MGKILYKEQEIPFTDLSDFISTLDLDSLKTWERECFSFIYDWLNPTINHFNAPTSGSTGKPKIISLHRKDMIQSAKFTLDYLKLKKEHKALMCLPAKFIGGKMMLVRSFVGDLALQIIEPTGNPLHSIKDAIDFIALTPYQFQNSLKNGKKDQLQTITKTIIGGGTLHLDTIKQLSHWTHDVFLTYGMTECISHIAMSKLNKASHKALFELISSEFTISKDERGCLVIETPYEHARTISTNDLINLNTASSFNWLGRYDNVINSGGIKINPEEIESKIESIIDVPFFLAGRPDKALGEKLILIIERGSRLSYEDILLAIGDAIKDKYLVPKEIIEVAQFTYTANYKINRRQTLRSLN